MEEAYVNELSLSDVQSFIESGRGIVIDTLVPEHFEERHIQGAVNACVYEMVFVPVVADIAPDKATPVLLYGAGAQSLDCMAAAEKLTREGYTDVSVFAGGLDEWREAGLPLEGSATGEVVPPHPQLTLEERKYALIPDESEFSWVGRSSTARHHGTLSLTQGEFDAAGEPSARFVLDMNSIENVNLEGTDLKPVLETHLKSDDFFFTTLFPTAEFETTVIKLVDDGEATRPNAMIQGKLSVRGVSQEIAFPAHLRNLEEGKIALVANLDFDRTQWGVIYGSSRFYKHLGYHLVFDFISVDFKLVLG